MSAPFELELPGSNQDRLEFFEQSDADVIIRMLYFCADMPRYDSQVMSYCRINRKQLVRFSKHCIERGLLKIAPSPDGSLCLVATDHGKEVLSTAQDIMDGLGIKLATDER